MEGAHGVYTLAQMDLYGLSVRCCGISVKEPKQHQKSPSAHQHGHREDERHELGHPSLSRSLNNKAPTLAASGSFLALLCFSSRQVSQYFDAGDRTVAFFFSFGF